MPAAPTCTVIELRQYTLHAGQRDVLIELFDREFVETQEALGITVIGQFRDLGDAERFVWLRGFADMAARASALQAFYAGPVWTAHRERANATMVDSDNVLLLRPAPGESLAIPARARDAAVGAQTGTGVVIATICPLRAPAGAALLAHFDRTTKPALQAGGASLLCAFVTEPSANNFARLPVREGEQVFVWLAAHPDRANAHRVAAWEGLLPWLRDPPRILRLTPTLRSRLQV